jgi:hypothetical protein
LSLNVTLLQLDSPETVPPTVKCAEGVEETDGVGAAADLEPEWQAASAESATNEGTARKRRGKAWLSALKCSLLIGVSMERRAELRSAGVTRTDRARPIHFAIQIMRSVPSERKPTSDEWVTKRHYSERDRRRARAPVSAH